MLFSSKNWRGILQSMIQFGWLTLWLRAWTLKVSGSCIRNAGASPYYPRMMLVILYAYMNNIYSAGKESPSPWHPLYLACRIWETGFHHHQPFPQPGEEWNQRGVYPTVLLLSSKGFISLNVEYIDGTKIESKANKYTFVWRKTVEWNRERLMKKIHILLGQIDNVIAQENSSESNEEIWVHPVMPHWNGGRIASKHSNRFLNPPRKRKRLRWKRNANSWKELEEHRDKLQEYDNRLDTLQTEFLFQNGQWRYFHENEGGCHA